MTSGHVHSGGGSDLQLGRWPRIVVLGLIALCGLAAAAGVVRWWPDQQRVDHLRGIIPFAAPGYTLVHARLLEVVPSCTGPGTTATTARCGDSKAEILDGPRTGRAVSIALSPEIVRSGLEPDDHVLLFDGTDAVKPDTSGIAGGDQAFPDFSFYRADRGQPMLLLLVLFAIAVIAVARWRGLLALVSLGLAGLVVVGYLIPALLSGRPAVPVTLAAATLILVAVLYLTHGFSMRTSVALLGALVGIGLSTLLGYAGIVSTRLAGIGDDSASLLGTTVTWIDVQQLIVASVVLAGIGTLNDVTVTQASALWELRSAAPDLGRWELFQRAMRIGRDHVASTVYTIVFAYLGTALVLLVAVQLYGGGAADFLTAEDVAEEIVRVLVGGIALVLAMPVTTAIGSLVVATADIGAADRAPTSRTPHYYRGSSIKDGHRRLPDDPWTTD